MKNVKVLGPGCKRCEATADMVRTEAEKLGVESSSKRSPICGHCRFRHRLDAGHRDRRQGRSCGRSAQGRRRSALAGELIDGEG